MTETYTETRRSVCGPFLETGKDQLETRSYLIYIVFFGLILYVYL